MPQVTVGRENAGHIQIYYVDHGTGPPVVLVHGYLADGHCWEKQETALLAADLNVLLEELDVQDAVLVGCCFGTGEVVRYLGTHRPRRIRAAALLAQLPPFPPRPLPTWTPSTRTGPAGVSSATSSTR